jgi:hypothetical protein
MFTSGELNAGALSLILRWPTGSCRGGSDPGARVSTAQAEEAIAAKAKDRINVFSFMPPLLSKPQYYSYQPPTIIRRRQAVFAL